MGKKGKRLIGVVGVLFLVMLVYVVVTKVIIGNTDTEDDTTRIAVSQIGAENITAFSYACEETNGEFLTMIRENDIWYYEEDRNFPLNQSFVTSMAKTAAEINASRVLEGDLQELSEYGLENPSLTAHVTQKNGDIVTFYVGDYNETAEAYYLKKEGDSNIYLVNGSLKMSFDMSLYELVKMEEYPTVETGSFVHVKIEKDDLVMEIKGVVEEDASEYIENNYLEKEKTWYISVDGSEYKKGNQVRIKALIEELSGYSFFREVNYKAENSELVSYGLENPSITITVDYQVLDETTARVVEHGDRINEIVCDTLDKQYILYIGNETSDKVYAEDYYAKLKNSNAICTVETSTLNRILELNVDQYLK